MNFSVNQNSKSTKSYQIDSFHHFISHFVVGCLAPSGARFRGGSGTPQHLGGGTTGWKTTTWDWWISWWWIYESMNLKDQQKHICSSIISCFFFLNPVTLLDSWKSNTQFFFFNGRNTEASEWMRTRPWNGALHRSWSCTSITCGPVIVWPAKVCERTSDRSTGTKCEGNGGSTWIWWKKILSDLGGVFLVFHIVFGWCWRNSLKMMPFIYTWNFFLAIPILRERFASPRIFFLYFPTKWGAFLEPHNPQKSQGSYCRLFS